MDQEPPLRRDHSTSAARENVIEHFNPKARVANVKSHQQPHEFSIVQLLNIHTDGGGNVDVGSACVTHECSGSGDNATLAARKQPMEDSLFQSRTVSRVQPVKQCWDARSIAD